MALRKLNTKIFRLVASLLCLTSFAIILFVWLATNNHVEAQLDRELDVAEEVFKQVLKNTENQLYNSAQVLTADFGFKQAVATNDKATINSVLKNHGERISADLMSLINLDGVVISSTSKGLENKQFPDQRLLDTAIENGGSIAFLQFEKRLYQVILLTIDAPRTIAVAQLGFEINNNLVESLKNITKLDIIVSSSDINNNNVVISSLTKEHTKKILSRESESAVDFDKNKKTMLSNKEEFLSKTFELMQSDTSHIKVTLAEDVNTLYREFHLLQYQMLTITVIAIFLALLLVAIFSKNMTLPLSLLASKTSSIAKGDYESKLVIDANSEEINDLVNSFDKMQLNIRDREEKIRHQANHDLLTNLHNRFSISDLIQKKYDFAETFSIIGINIIDFRSINDTFGYTIGDACVKEIASRLNSTFQPAARLNGGEMIAINSNDISFNEIEKIKKKLEKPIFIGDISININLAFCQLTLPRDAETLEDVFRRISLTLDQAQQEASQYLAYTPELEQRYLEKLNILKLLKSALNKPQAEFSIAYQPKLHSKSNTIFKSEALIRWNHSTAGFISPELFIPIAEQAGLIHQITEFVIKQVIHDLQQWKKEGIEHQAAINLSVHDIDNEALLPWILDALDQAKLQRDVLSFEITESELMKDPHQATQKLLAFREAGFNLAIDDFGTGYSSLSYLKYMPITELKIDKSFVLKLNEQTDDQNIVQTIMALANNFKLEVVAEGVENEESLSILKQWGCDWIQGYHISRPIPAEQLVSWLLENKKHYG